MLKYKLEDKIIYTNPQNGIVYIGRVIGITAIENDKRPYHVYVKVANNPMADFVVGWAAEDWLQPQGIENSGLTRA